MSIQAPGLKPPSLMVPISNPSNMYPWTIESTPTPTPDQTSLETLSKSSTRSRWKEKLYRTCSTSSDGTFHDRTTDNSSAGKSLYSNIENKASTNASIPTSCLTPFSLFENRPPSDQCERLPSDWRRVPTRTNLALKVRSWGSTKTDCLPLWDAFVERYSAELEPHLRPNQVSENSLTSFSPQHLVLTPTFTEPRYSLVPRP